VAGVTGAKAAAAAATDNAKRYQSIPGYTVPLPKNWVADHVTEDRIKQWIKEDRTDSKGSGAEK